MPIAIKPKYQRYKIYTLYLLLLKGINYGLKSRFKVDAQELDKVKDPTFIEAIKNMLKYRKKVSTERISIEQYNKEIDASIAEIESGKTYSHKEMDERIKQWAKQ